MRWKPWLIACVSVLALACATAPEPPLTATVVMGTLQSKRALELNGRDYTLTLTSMGMDKRPQVRTATGKLEKEEYGRLVERVRALDFTAFKPLYTSNDLDMRSNSTSLRLSFGGRQVTVTVMGRAPAAVEPLLAPFLPLLDRPI